MFTIRWVGLQRIQFIVQMFNFTYRVCSVSVININLQTFTTIFLKCVCDAEKLIVSSCTTWTVGGTSIPIDAMMNWMFVIFGNMILTCLFGLSVVRKWLEASERFPSTDGFSATGQWPNSFFFVWLVVKMDEIWCEYVGVGRVFVGSFGQHLNRLVGRNLAGKIQDTVVDVESRACFICLINGVRYWVRVNL